MQTALASPPQTHRADLGAAKMATTKPILGLPLLTIEASAVSSSVPTPPPLPDEAEERSKVRRRSWRTTDDGAWSSCTQQADCQHCWATGGQRGAASRHEHGRARGAACRTQAPKGPRSPLVSCRPPPHPRRRPPGAGVCAQGAGPAVQEEGPAGVAAQGRRPVGSGTTSLRDGSGGRSCAPPPRAPPQFLMYSMPP